MIHSRFDLDRWIREFPLERQRAEVRAWIAECERERPESYENAAAREAHVRLMDPSGELVVGPKQVATIEQLRREAGGDLGRGVPVDVMVWARGEPEHRAATKVGGVPYRPRSEPWPEARDGGPSMFLGQVCFSDSLDLRRARRLPGEVMLVFAPNADGIWDSDEEEPESLQIEWWPLGLNELIEPGDVPKAKWIATAEGGLEPCHAELHRSRDYPGVPEDHPIYSYREAERLCVFEGGKIGGRAFLAQADPPCRGDFLCSLGSIHPVGRRWPLLNVEENPDGEFELNGGFLMFGDVGTLYFGLSEQSVPKRATIHWGLQGY